MASKDGGPKAKRGQGEGHFTHLESGRVRWRVMVTSKAGERRHPSGTARNLTEARKAVREVREAAERDALPPREKMTIEKLVSEYIEARKPSIKGRTVENYQAILKRNITPSIGPLKAQGISTQRLREFYDGLRESGQGDSVRRQVHNLIHAAYRMGLAENWVTVNPAARARPIYTDRGSAGRPQSFTPDEAVRFYLKARADRWGWPLVFMLATGMRPGEALGLRWAELTFNPDGSVSVPVERTRSVSGGKVYEDTPKTDRGRRTVTVKGDAAAMLQEVRAQSEREAGARLVHNGKPYQVTGYVFTSRAGTPYRPDNLRRPMRRLCEAAGVPLTMTPHKLRHTWASVLASRGVSIEVLAAQLGHRDAAVTRKYYRQVFESERESLTYDPVSPPPSETRPPQRRTLKVKRLKARATQDT